MAEISNNIITSVAKNICYPTAPGIFTGSDPTGGSGVYTYNWQQAPYPAGSPWTNCPGASTVRTNFNYTNPITSSLLIRRVVHSVGYTDSISAPQVLTVYAVMAAGNVSGTQTICYNSAPTQFTSLQAGSGGAPGGTYNWQKSTNNSTDVVQSTSILNLQNQPITGLTALATLDATFAGKIVEANGTFTITLPNSMSTGMWVDIVNVGTGTITLAASTTLQSSGTKLATQYTGASCYHRGSNVWIAVGKLTT